MFFFPGLSIFWSHASARGFSIHDVVRVMCEEPANLSRLSHRKGKIAAGMDADFVIWDPDEAIVVRVGTVRNYTSIIQCLWVFPCPPKFCKKLPSRFHLCSENDHCRLLPSY